MAVWGPRYEVCGMRYAVYSIRYEVAGMRYQVCGMWDWVSRNNYVDHFFPGPFMKQ